NSGTFDVVVADRDLHLLRNRSSVNGPPAEPLRSQFDPVFNVPTAIVDELGRQTLFEIDPYNGNTLTTTRVVGELDALSGETDDVSWQYTYTTLGLIDTVIDPLGRLTDYDYDTNGRLTRITFAVGTVDQAFVEFEYDAAGNQTGRIDENGNRTEYEYDSLNRLFKVTESDPDGTGPLTAAVSRFVFDENGNVVETIDAKDNTVRREFDSLDRPVRVEDSHFQTTLFEYDPQGNLLRVTDPLGHTVTSRYDARNRVIQAKDSADGMTRFFYDPDDNLAQVTDANDNTTRFVYDARSRLIREDNPLGESKRYSFDAADNLFQMTDRNGRTTDFVYDDLDRVVAETWKDADGNLSNTIDYAYDRASNLVSAVDSVSSLTLSYDSRDRVKTVTSAGTIANAGLPTVMLDYGYDGVGNRVSVTETIDGNLGSTTSYAYDGRNRMTMVQQSGGGSERLVDLAYNQLGQFDQLTRYSDLARTGLVSRSDYQYDALNRLTELDHRDATDAVLAFYDFTYDEGNRITQIADSDGVTQFAYDDRDQLTGADRDSSDSRGDELYQYDANGNRLQSHRHDTDYVTGEGNRLLSDGRFDYVYDGEGNVVERKDRASDVTREMIYDHRNRLTRITERSAEGVITLDVHYTYDALDRRIAKSVDDDGEGSGVERTTYFVYDGVQVLLEFEDVDGSGTAQQPELTRRYLYGPEIDQVLAQELVQTGETQWLLADHLGSIRDVVDDGGQLVNHIQYDSFGNVLSQSDSVNSSRFLYTGREFDSESELYYYRARYYDANIGR
ncbi:MAG: RHS repeat protein, partial [Planctomycetales bacterium]|nr:RHS repeat protein [Planctomycetales bacterium]